jgi:hypothetical protein
LRIGFEVVSPAMPRSQMNACTRSDGFPSLMIFA